ncbi:MAG: tail fiber domain-containing protein [Acidobacteriota bacterium]
MFFAWSLTDVLDSRRTPACRTSTCRNLARQAGCVAALALVFALCFPAPQLSASGLSTSELSTSELSTSELELQDSSAECSDPQVSVQDGHLIIAAEPAAAGAVVTLRDVDGQVHRSRVEVATGAAVPLVNASGEPLKDGLVVWEVRFEGVPAGPRTEASFDQPVQLPWTSRGAFSISAGRALPQRVEGESLGDGLVHRGAKVQEGVLVEGLIQGDTSIKDHLCVGADCVDPEAFGDDAIRLKGNRLRQHFEDTSVGNFPDNDWRILVNDLLSGGADFFAIEDVNTSRVPVLLEAGAPADALRIAGNGDLGLGTANPAADIHVISSNTPELRLEQTNSSGFSAQTWSVEANESLFVISDETSSTLPVRIRRAAPTHSLYIAPDGSIGLGSAAPQAALEVERNDGTAKILVEETSVVAGNTIVFEATSDSGNIQTFFQPATGSGWKQNFRGADFRLDSQEDADDELLLTTAGDMTVNSLTETSDRAMKENFRSLDRGEVLSKIVELPITRWNYIEKGPEVQHIGPMAQDFYGAFGVGPDERHIASRDAASVALVGVQALYDELRNRGEQIEALQAANAALLERLEALERRLDE